MQKSRIIIILASLAVILVTSVIIFTLSPEAYEQQCILTAKNLITNLYSIEGSKDEFLKSFSQDSLSNEAKTDLQYLRNVINQCHELKSNSEDRLDINISILN